LNDFSSDIDTVWIKGAAQAMEMALHANDADIVAMEAHERAGAVM
jgi:hypothetical protein